MKNAKQFRVSSADVETWNAEDAEDLHRSSRSENYEITVSSRDWTVQTIVNQIEEGNIDLDPAFQRRNAWRDHRRSRLIESFILGFPVPQLVLAENPRQRGSFIVIDGKQRLMTIAGAYLEAYRDYWNVQRFTGLKILDHLNGTKLKDFFAKSDFIRDRRRLGNADIRTTVITGFNDEATLYDIFYRINTGSVPLSTQELRQVLNRGDFAKFLLKETSAPNSLWQVLKISRPDPRLRDVELLLRLIAFKLFAPEYKGNLKVFLDDAMQKLNDSWSDREEEVRRTTRQLFRATEVATQIFGEHVGRAKRGQRYERLLNRALFEVQVFFLSTPHVRRAAILKGQEIATRVESLFDDVEFSSSIQSTTKSLDNYRYRFEAYREIFEKTLGVTVPALKLPSAKK